ncbi:MAG TPA: hypothetical protein VFZ61_06080, partial [Polyangiales bacterium]
GHAAAQPAQTNAPDAAPRAPESRAHPEREVAEAESNAVSTTPVLATPLEPSRPAVDTRTAPQPSPVELLEPAPHAAVAPEARPVAAPPVPAPEQLPLPVETSAQPSAAPVAAAPVAPGVQGVPQPAHTPAQHAASAGAPAPDATRGVVDAVELSGPPLQIHARAARHDAPALEAQATESEPESEGAREQRAADATQPAASQQPLMAPAMPAPAAQPASGPQVSSAKAPPRPAAPAQPALDSADATASLVGMRDNQTGATVTRVEFFQAVSDASVDSAPRAQARLQPAAAASAQVETVSAPAAPVAPTQTVRATPALAQPTLAQPALAQPALTQALTQAAPSAEPDGSALLGLDAAPATVEATPEQPAAAGSEELEANAQPSHDESSEHDDAAPQEQSSGGESADAKPQAQPVAPQVAFQPSDAHGMRGLDAIVASLLRTGAPEPEAAPSARGPAGMAQVELGKVETAKSESTKSAEKQSLESGLLKDRVLAREEERQNLREALEIEPAHPFHAEAKVDLQASEAPADAAPVPLPSPQLIQDPDAAMMGKIARGEGVNAAAISIDHPDFGAMDLVVENENGRIDVRAVLETPKAAAVMRAQESALRYGIQQAGMTFGALRVRSRGEEPTQLKARDNTKSSRRPGHEWEA